MKRWLTVVAVLALSACSDEGGSAVAAAPIPATCFERPPCVYVTPDPAQVDEPGTVFLFRGRGWPRRAKVQAQYGNYCGPPKTGCDDVGRITNLRADGQGRFTFRLQYAEELDASVARPAAAGGGQDTMRFVSYGRTGRVIQRDAVPPPPPASPQQSAEAAAIAGAVRRVEKATLKRSRALGASIDRYHGVLGRCEDLRRFKEGSARDETMSVLIGLAFDAATLGPIVPQLRAFADELERVAPADPVLRAATDAWIAAVRRERPWPPPDFCEPVRQWRATGFDLQRAPVDRRAGETLQLEYELETSKAIRDGAARLRAFGAGQEVEDLFAEELIELGRIGP